MFFHKVMVFNLNNGKIFFHLSIYKKLWRKVFYLICYKSLFWELKLSLAFLCCWLKSQLFPRWSWLKSEDIWIFTRSWSSLSWLEVQSRGQERQNSFFCPLTIEERWCRGRQSSLSDRRHCRRNSGRRHQHSRSICR